MSYPFGKSEIRSQKIFCQDYGENNHGKTSQTQESSETRTQTTQRLGQNLKEYSIYQKYLSSNSIAIDWHPFKVSVFSRPSPPITIGESNSRDWVYLRSTGQRLEFIGNSGLGTICLETYRGDHLKTANQASSNGSSARRFSQIIEKHWVELTVNSAIDPEIAQLNFTSYSPGSRIPYELLLYSENIPRTNTGRLTGPFLKKYAHLEDGGWHCAGVDPLNNLDQMEWGCFKPDNPRQDEQKGKLIKYETPAKIATRVFFLTPSYTIWEQIAHRYNVSMPEIDPDESLGLQFWSWVRKYPEIKIIITEGAKKAAALLSIGLVAIALPGINSGYRTNRDEEGNVIGRYLIPELEWLCSPNRVFQMGFDEDSKRSTRRNVAIAQSRLSRLLRSQTGADVEILSWPSELGKGADDVISTYGEDTFYSVVCNAISFDIWSTKQYKLLTYSADYVVPDGERYIPNDIRPPADKQLICIKSPTGTGKTGWIANYTDPWLKTGERKILVITHRVQLGLQTCQRIGIPYISENAKEDYAFGCGLCLDSLKPDSQARFNPDDERWHGAIVALDEINQSIWHLLNSTTLRKDRIQILNNLKRLLRNVIKTGGKIIIADAHLRDSSIDFIEKLIQQPIQRWILENEWRDKANIWDIYNFAGKSPRALIKEAEKNLEAGEKILFLSSAQKPRSQYGTYNLETLFKERFPHLRIARIDSETVVDETNIAFRATQNINEFIKDYDLVIVSPTIETGVSIEVKYFNAVFGIIQGVQMTDSVRQFLARYRPNVPRYLYVKSTALTGIGGGEKTVMGVIKSEKNKDKETLNQLARYGMEETYDGLAENVALFTWAKYAAIINSERYCYRDTIINDLIEDGHRIHAMEELSDKQKNLGHLFKRISVGVSQISGIFFEWLCRCYPAFQF